MSSICRCRLVILFLATSFIFNNRSARAIRIGIFQRYEVHIINNLNNSNNEFITNELTVHCRSADDDLGEHFLDNGDDWHWGFRVNFFRSTLFFCQVQWRELGKRFTVFDTDDISSKCEETSTCFWSVREDGIYFGCDNQNYVKRQSWPWQIQLVYLFYLFFFKMKTDVMVIELFTRLCIKR